MSNLHPSIKDAQNADGINHHKRDTKHLFRPTTGGSRIKALKAKVEPEKPNQRNHNSE